MAADTGDKKKLGLFEGGLFGTGFGYGHPVSSCLGKREAEALRYTSPHMRDAVGHNERVFGHYPYMADADDVQYLPPGEHDAFREIREGRLGYTFSKEVKAVVDNFQPKYGLFKIRAKDCRVYAYLKDKDTMVTTDWLPEGPDRSRMDKIEKRVIIVDDTDFIDNPIIKFTEKPKRDKLNPDSVSDWFIEKKPSAFRRGRKLSNRVKKSSFKSAQKRRNLKNKSKSKRSRSPKSRRR
jgi:hypothetical protein